MSLRFFLTIDVLIVQLIIDRLALLQRRTFQVITNPFKLQFFCPKNILRLFSHKIYSPPYSLSYFCTNYCLFSSLNQFQSGRTVFLKPKFLKHSLSAGKSFIVSFNYEKLFSQADFWSHDHLALLDNFFGATILEFKGVVQLTENFLYFKNPGLWSSYDSDMIWLLVSQLRMDELLDLILLRFVILLKVLLSRVLVVWIYQRKLTDFFLLQDLERYLNSASSLNLFIYLLLISYLYFIVAIQWKQVYFGLCLFYIGKVMKKNLFCRKEMMKTQQVQDQQQQEELTEKTRKRRKLLKKIIRNNRQASQDRQFDILASLDKDLFAGYNHYRLGNFCIQQNRLQLAEENLNRAKNLIQRKFLFTNVYLSLGNLELKRNNRQKACEFYNAVIELSPHKNSKAYFNKDQLIFAAKLNSFASYVQAHNKLVKLYVEMNQYQKGFQFCKASIRLKQLEESAIVQFHDILCKLTGNHGEAKKFALDKLTQEVRNKGNPYFELIEPIKISHLMGFKNQAKQKKVNIMTLKWGSKYSFEYVNKLYSAIKKNTLHKLDFYCFTDDNYGIDKSIKIKPLDDQWKKQWGKVVLFNAQFDKGTNIYIDLDVVITGNLDQLFEYEGQFATLKCLKQRENDQQYPHHGYQSTVMIWNGKHLRRIYENIVKYFPTIEKCLVRFDYWLDIIVQDADQIQTLYPGTIVNFDPTNHSSAPPEHSAIVAFPKRPKVGQFPADWIKQLWVT